MRLVLQRVLWGAVTINGGERRETGAGLVVLAGICPSDDEAVCAWMAEKMANLRIFSDENDNMNRSLLDVEGECLLVSNFTLYAGCKKGRRPSFINAAPPQQAEALYRILVEKVLGTGVRVLKTGEFGAEMKIDMTCDGPVTILLDSDEIMPKRISAAID